HFPADGFDVAHVLGELDAVYDDAAPLVLLQAVDGADEGGFARTRRAADDDLLAPPHGGGNPPQGVVAAVPLVHVFADDDGIGRGRARARLPVSTHGPVPLTPVKPRAGRAGALDVKSLSIKYTIGAVR